MVAHLRLSLVLTAACFLCACMSDQSDSSTNEKQVAPTDSKVKNFRVVGRVIDGYLSNAKVCLDKNLNRICDQSGEFTVLTNQAGYFELSIPEDTELKNLIAEIVPGQTRDMDSPDLTISQRMVLFPYSQINRTIDSATGSVPDINSEIIISPVSTLVYAAAQQSGQAEQVYIDQLASAWNVAADRLTVDYIQNKDVLVHRLSKSVFAFWSNLAAHIEAQEVGKSWQQIFSLMQDTINSELIAQQVIPTALDAVLPAAPKMLLDDVQDSLDWEFTGTFTEFSQYEFSLDGGQTWQPVQSKPIQLGNQFIESGKINLRVAAQESLPAGHISFNERDFTARLENISAPQALVVDDRNNTLDWTFVSNFEQVSDYEISLDSGNSWQQVHGKPVRFGNINLAVGAVQIRVRENESRFVGASAMTMQPFTDLIQNISPPSGLVINDINDTLDWDWVLEYQSANDYEWSKDAGNSWQNVESKPIVVGDLDLASGMVWLRVKEIANEREAGEAAVTGVQYTEILKNIPAPKIFVDDVVDTVDWTYAEGFTSNSDYEWSQNGGQIWEYVTSKPLVLGDVDIDSGQIQLRVKAIIGERLSGLIATNEQPLTKKPEIISAPTNLVVDDALDTLAWNWVAGFESPENYVYSLNDSDVWMAVTRFPLQLSDFFVGKVQVKVNSEYAEKAETEADAFSITPFIKMANDGSRLQSDDESWTCLKDNRYETGLYWLRSSTDKVYWNNEEGENTTAVMSQKNEAQSNAVCGFSDWRVSKTQHLKHLIDNALWTTAPYFEHMQEQYYSYYWTEEPNPQRENHVLIVAANSTEYRLESSATDNHYVSKHYLVLTREQVRPETFLEQISLLHADLLNKKAVIETWSSEGVSLHLDIKEKVQKATTLNELQTVKVQLLAGIKQGSDRIPLIESILQNQNSALEMVRNGYALLQTNPDDLVTPEDLSEYQSQLNQFEQLHAEFLLSIEPNDQNSLSEEVTAMNGTLSVIQSVSRHIEHINEITVLLTATSELMATYNTTAQALADLEVQLKDTGVDIELAESLYRSGRTALSDLYEINSNVLQMPAELTWLVEILSQIPEGQFSDQLMANLQATKIRLETQASISRDWHDKHHSSVISAIDSAFDGGFVVTEDESKIQSGDTAFHKMDIKGRLIPSDTRFEQGYRCAKDIRYESDRIWLLMNSGEVGSDDQVIYSELDDESGLLSQANTESWCGKNNWDVPTINQLKTLNTWDDEKGSYYDLTIDQNVFIHHLGYKDEFENSDPFSRYRYWSKDSVNAGERLTYSYGVGGYSSPETLGLDESEYLDRNFKVFARLISYDEPQSQFEMLNVSGEVTQVESEWICSRHKESGLTWLRELHLPQPESPRNKKQSLLELGVANVCGSDQWRLPSKEELNSLLPLDEKHFGSIRLESNAYYLTDAEETNNWGGRYPMVFHFNTEQIQRGSEYSEYWNLWVTSDQSSSRDVLSTEFKGLDKNGLPTPSGVNYCIEHIESGKIWTTHLLTDTDKSRRSLPSTFSSYCGKSGSQWSVPTESQFRESLLQPYISNVHLDNQNGFYWLLEAEKQDPSCSLYCDSWYYAINIEGNKIKVDGGSYNESDKHYHRYFYQPEVD